MTRTGKHNNVILRAQEHSIIAPFLSIMCQGLYVTQIFRVFNFCWKKSSTKKFNDKNFVIYSILQWANGRGGATRPDFVQIYNHP